MRYLALSVVTALALAPAAFAQSTAPQPPTGPQGKPGFAATERQAQRAKEFDAMDANKDGKLTEQEMIDHAAARLRERFARMDPNKDGSVTKEEFLAPRARSSMMGSDKMGERHHRAMQPEGTR